MLVVAGPTIDFFPPELEAVKAFLKRGGKLLLMLDPPAKDGNAGSRRASSPSRGNGASTSAGTSCVDPAGSASSSARTRRCRSACRRRTPITDQFRKVHGVSARAIGDADRRRRGRQVRAEADRDGPAGLGRDRHQGRSTRPASLTMNRPRATSPDRSRSRPPRRRPRRTRRRAGADARRAEAGNPRRRRRRQRLRVEPRHRARGQRGSVPEHEQLAGAAGKPDRHPAEGSRTTAASS